MIVEYHSPILQCENCRVSINFDTREIALKSATEYVNLCRACKKLLFELVESLTVEEILKERPLRTAGWHAGRDIPFFYKTGKHPVWMADFEKR